MRSIFLSVALISGAALAYEILLIRLLSIVQWHHFAYLIISLALLGYGASATALVLLREAASANPHRLYAVNAVLFAVSTLACFVFAQQLPFNGLELIWDPWQIAWLAGLYVTLAIPFFFAANCIGLTFVVYPREIPRLYRWDLIGAGIGCVAILLVLFFLPPQACLVLIPLVGVLAAVLMLFNRRAKIAWSVSLSVLVIATVVFIILPGNWPTLKISQYKGLPQILAVKGTEVIHTASSPLGLLNVVQSEEIPLRHAPGLSLTAEQEPPLQLGVFIDASGMLPITRFDGDTSKLEYLGQQSSALPYHLLNRPRVLVLGAGGGADVLQALYHEAEYVDAVELNPQIIDLVRNRYGKFAGDLYRHPRVDAHVADVRGFLAASRSKYDLIQISLLDSFASAGAGTHALSENYTYTRQAIGAYLDHLAPNGYLAITRWLKLPPRDTLKLFATVVAVLEERGIRDPAERLIVVRSWQTATLVIKNSTLSIDDITTLRDFSRQRGFDVAYFPGIRVDEANRFNRMQQPYIFDAASAILGEQRADYLEEYKFNLTPASDDRPFFFHFFKWSALPELFSLREQGGLVLLESGYLVLIGALIQAVPVSIFLILLPLLFLKPQRLIYSRRGLAGTYFFLLGLAFLMIEIAFIQRFIVFVSHPLYAVAVVLSSFLVFAGLGSGSAKQLQGLCERYGLPVIGVSAGLIGVLSIGYLLLLSEVFDQLIALPIAIKMAIAAVLVAPLAFFMGMPFPLGLSMLAKQVPAFIPWAWGINGCASVISALLASLVAVHFGFTVVIVVAVVLYLLAAVISRRAFAAPA